MGAAVLMGLGDRPAQTSQTLQVPSLASSWAVALTSQMQKPWEEICLPASLLPRGQVPPPWGKPHTHKLPCDAALALLFPPAESLPGSGAPGFPGEAHEVLGARARVCVRARVCTCVWTAPHLWYLHAFSPANSFS